MDSKGEFLITVMSSISQEESRSISENVRWGVKKRMADGKYSVNYTQFIGYDRGTDGEMVVNRNEAKVVRFIYRSCLQGYSDTEIAKLLMEMGVPAPCGGETWHASVVSHMLSNEKKGRRADSEKLHGGFPGQAAAQEQGRGSAVLCERRT